MKFLLDSVILIDHFNSIELATTFLRGYRRKNFLISVITRAEVLAGFKEPHTLNMAKQVLSVFETLPITTKDADKAAQLRQQFHWKLPDAIQAALAVNYNLKLVTRNTKDFKTSKHAFVYEPYVLP